MAKWVELIALEMKVVSGP
jgi:hypothetical protein